MLLDISHHTRYNLNIPSCNNDTSAVCAISHFINCVATLI